MKNFILLLSIYFILFLQYGYTRTISIESTDIPDELISRFDNTTSWGKGDKISRIKKGCIPDSLTYCKDNVCVCVDSAYIKPFIELPDKNGYIHRYILIPYAFGYKDVISSYIESKDNKTIHVSTDCKTDTQCFSNKCFNNTCTYNENANVVRCDPVYEVQKTLLSESYTLNVYCGRMLGEYCTKNTDCSYKSCGDNRCQVNNYVPYVNGLDLAFRRLYFLAGIIITLIIICCCCCYVKSHKKNNINVKK